MSDYISIKDDRLWQILFDEACVEGQQSERIQKELEKIAVDEKEIIRKPFERVLKRLEQQKNQYKARSEKFAEALNSWEERRNYGKACSYDHAIKILKEECEINE